METNFLGKAGFTWWLGTVENRADPLGLGRCQVRLFGYHGDGSQQSLNDIPVTDLPWAFASYPINNSKTFQAPQLKDWVWGFFLDGESAQQPIMVGVIPGFISQAQIATS
jgi:hypothetical protein